jgi:hypothetical protein
MTPPLTATWTLIAGALVLILPGIAWQALVWDPDQDIFERLAEAIGVSISLTALVALFTYVFGWQISSAALIVFYLLLVPLAVWALRQYYKDYKLGKKASTRQDENDPSDEVSTEKRGFQYFLHQGRFRYLFLALIFIFVLAWRFYQIRDVVLPLWVDSIHHVQIVKLLLEHRSLPETFEPYMPVAFYYHYAFHAVGAVFSFIGRLSPENSVLYLGQALNAGIALAVYRLGKAIWGDWRRAVLSALLVAFATHMPAYYVTWGRYTLLAGMLLLPLAMATALDILTKGAKVSRLATFVVLTAGILLTHYFAAVLLAIFLIILAVLAVLQDLMHKSRSGWRTWMPLLLASLAGLLLAGPWLYRMWGFTQGSVIVGAIQPSIQAMEEVYFPDYLAYLWRLLGPDRNHFLLFLALPGLVITLFHKRTLVFGLWTITLCLMSLPFGIYMAPFRPDHAAIVLFLPTALLIAELFISALDWSPGKSFTRIKTIPILILFAAMVGWGIWGTRTVINSATILATNADLEAVNWIDRNIPENAHFLINVTHWQYGSYRGVDGGWWITPLTDRNTILPNALYAMGDSDYKNQVNSLAAQVSQIKGCTPEFWELVSEEDLTHIYLKQGLGSMQTSHFENCPGVELIYDKDDVYVYRIRAIIK